MGINRERKDKRFIRLWFKDTNHRHSIEEVRGGLLELRECKGVFGGSGQNQIARPKGSINKSHSPG